MQIDKKEYELHINIFDDVALFDEALNVCEELADQTQKRKEETLATFTNILALLHECLESCGGGDVVEFLSHEKSCQIEVPPPQLGGV